MGTHRVARRWAPGIFLDQPMRITHEKGGKAPRAGPGPGLLLAGMCPGSSAPRRDENWRGNRMRP